MFEIDVRGLSCPIPVVRTKKAIENNPKEEIVVLVDSETSKENVSRLAKNKGYSVSVEQIENEFRISLDPE